MLTLTSTAISPLPTPAVELPSLIDLYLRDQQSLTAVDEFTQFHAGVEEPVQARHYRALLPSGLPQPGQQYAFEVDLDACSGCKACVTACHSLNGLDEHELWRSVGLLHGGSAELPVLQHATTACHHCLEPACLDACPVRAYEKNATTGIVRHLDDQCIGCQYCIFACPYEVPKYSRSRGIVRKCDMCADRLAVGEAPACVQACPHQAIRISVVEQQEVRDRCADGTFLPAAPEPSYTLPTTLYKSRRKLPSNMLPADLHTFRPEHAHWPLIVMLVLTQLSVGAFLVEFALDLFVRQAWFAQIRPVQAMTSLGVGLLALNASVLHLGRPQYAFRAVLGLRTSWLSREIVAFGAFAGFASLHAAIVWFGITDAVAGANVSVLVAAGVAISGLAGVACSIKVYQCTRRPYWSATGVSGRFLLSMLVLGIATTLFVATISAALSPAGRELAAATRVGLLLSQAIAILMTAKLLIESAVLLHLRHREVTPLKRSAVLLTGDLARVTSARFALGLIGGLFIPLLMTSMVRNGRAVLGDTTSIVVVSLLFIALVAGELAERYLFFTAVTPPKMPGGVTA